MWNEEMLVGTIPEAFEQLKNESTFWLLFRHCFVWDPRRRDFEGMETIFRVIGT